MNPAPFRRGEDVVVDICDVADTTSLVPQVAKTALQHVVGDVCGRVAKMSGVVGRYAAHVHCHNWARCESNGRTLVSVVELHRLKACAQGALCVRIIVNSR